MDIDKLILERMQRLLCLSMEGQPASELIQGTARVWCEALGQISPERLIHAFDSVEENETRWPTPAVIRKHLPTYSPRIRYAQLESDEHKEERQKNLKRLDDLAQSVIAGKFGNRGPRT